MSARDGDARLGRAITYGLWGVIVLTAVLRLMNSWTRFLQVDELQILHLAWLRVDGSVPGTDHFMPQFSLLIDALEPMWWCVGNHFEGVWLARTLMFGVSCATLFMTYKLAKQLTGATAAIGAVVCLSLFTDFNDRAFDVRSDGLIVLCWLCTVYWLLPGTRRAYHAGAAVALSIAFNFKALVALPAFAVLALLPDDWPDVDDAEERRALRQVVLKRSLTCALKAAAGFAATAAVYLLYLAARGDLSLYFSAIERNLSSSSSAAGVSAWPYFKQSLTRNPVFYALVVEGVVLTALGGRRSIVWLPIGLLVGMFVMLNPTFFPYNFVDIAPFLALLGGIAIAWVLNRERVAPAVLVLSMLAALPLYRQAYLIKPTIGDQFAINELVQRITAQDDRVYDASGMIMFRRGPKHWRLHSLILRRYNRGGFILANDLQATPVRVFLPSYRTRWLTPHDRAFVRRFYPKIGRFGLIGWNTAAGEIPHTGSDAVVLLEGLYQIATKPSGLEEMFAINNKRYVGAVLVPAGTLKLSWHGPGPAPRAALIWAPPQLSLNAQLINRRAKLFYNFRY